MTEPNQSEMDLLERAVAELTSAPVPDGRLPQLISATISSVTSALPAPAALTASSSFWSKRITLLQFSVFGVLFLLACCTATLFVQGKFGSKVDPPIARSEAQLSTAVTSSTLDKKPPGFGDAVHLAADEVGDVAFRGFTWSGGSGGILSGNAVILGGSSQTNSDAAGGAGTLNVNGALGTTSPAPVVRKIVRVATLDVLVADFDQSRGDLEKLIGEYKGDVVKSDFVGNAGAKRTGTWTIRVPTERFDQFRKAVIGLGQALRNATDASDVTDEFVDMETDIKTLKAKEAKLNELLKAKAQSFEDVLKWEKEVENVHAELARKEARLLTLSRLTTMATVYVTLRDEKELPPPPPAPPPPPVEPTTRNTLLASFNALAEFGQYSLFVAAALAPWLPLIVVVIFIAIRVARHFGFPDDDGDDDEQAPTAAGHDAPPPAEDQGRTAPTN